MQFLLYQKILGSWECLYKNCSFRIIQITSGLSMGVKNKAGLQIDPARG